MIQATEVDQATWTAADLSNRFGEMPLVRILFDPQPGTATEDDVIAIHDRSSRLCELVDGVLVDKAAGTCESLLSLRIARSLGNFVDAQRLGVVLGADGFIRFAPGLIRIPDAAYISWKNWSTKKARRTRIADLSPDLVVEFISAVNTPEETERKLREYLDAGAQLVWYIYPNEESVHVFTGVEKSHVLTAYQTLDGGAVLPGFTVKLEEFFAEPAPPEETA